MTRDTSYRRSVERKPPAARPLTALFPRSPHMVKWVNTHKDIEREYLVRSVEFDLDSRHSTTKDRIFHELWEAAIYSVERMEGQGVTVTAYTRPAPDAPLEPVWRTFLRPSGIAVCGAFGLTEKGTARAARAAQAREAQRHRKADLAPPPRPMTRAEKRSAVNELLTPRLVAKDQVQRSPAPDISKEEKAQLIADLFTPRLT